MKTQRNFPSATVSKKCEAYLKAGHSRVFAEEIKALPDGLENGCLCDVMSERGTYLGTGFLSLHSKIRITILSDNANETFGEGFFRRRLRYALDYRKTVMKNDLDCCRLVFGEADGLPGLTVDRYGSLLSTQVLSYGVEMRKKMLYDNLVSLLHEDGIKIDGIFERNDVSIRELEGLKPEKGWYEGLSHVASAVCEITENGIKYNVDVENGQKTGFFLDQKYNRAAVARLSEGRRVLDCFTHTGSFALNAAYGGAKKVTAVDISAVGIQAAQKNAEKNGLTERMDFLCEDIFDLLPRLEKTGSDYDFIILDPPAFTKSRAEVKDARRGYKEINYRAMKLLPRGGLLATCSCSRFMTRELFEQMLRDAADDAGVRLKLIEARRQSPDHPVILGDEDSDYLKFYLFQIV